MGVCQASKLSVYFFLFLALESFAQGTLTLAEMESGLKDCLNVPSSGEVSAGGDAPIKEVSYDDHDVHSHCPFSFHRN